MPWDGWPACGSALRRWARPGWWCSWLPTCGPRKRPPQKRNRPDHDPRRGLRFAEEWVSAWNAHDLDHILGHYSDHFEMTTPFIVKLRGEFTGTLKGKEQVRAYWQQ